MKRLLAGQTPVVREAERVKGPGPVVTPVRAIGPVKGHESRLIRVQRKAVLAESLPRVGGLHHRYARAA